MFVDKAKVFIKAGRGGNGAVSFLREKYIDKGGPDGGDGGRGGDIIICGDVGLSTLVAFRYHPKLKAEAGQNGSKRNKRGRSGESLVVKVPFGTVIKDLEDNIIADITTDEMVVIAKGGKGGFGNAHFKSSTRQAPRIVERGEPGEATELVLELKLLADVGLIGFPNAGKSTFLSVVSNARPKIADYAFTTLTPMLGVVDVGEDSLLIADIPGLIEGASQGKGLGDTFLRHIERTSVLLHLIDVYQDDIAQSYKVIRKELKQYSIDISSKPELVCVTKIDGVDEELVRNQIRILKKTVPKGTQVFAISSHSKHHLKELIAALLAKVHSIKSQESKTEDKLLSAPVISLNEQDNLNRWKVQKSDNVFIVTGPKIERFALRTEFMNPHSINRLRDIMKKIGITHELKRQGADASSVIKIADREFTLVEAI